jgi:hypothetical protein
VQVGTTQRPTGGRTKDATFNSPDGKETYVGKADCECCGAPWQIVATDATLTLKNPQSKGDSLDANGMLAACGGQEKWRNITSRCRATRCMLCCNNGENTRR